MLAHFCLSIMEEDDAWEDRTSHGNPGVVLFVYFSPILV